MKFIDEATISVHAGDGGSGRVGFRRELYAPQGGPNGGDGGDGGSVYLHADSGLNTLADFRYTRHFEAENGEKGGTTDCNGRGGADIKVRVPVGTLVWDVDTGELLGDMIHAGQELMVARGGFHGLGNTRFKSSVNRAPRQFSRGKPGEERNLRLELKLLADVGLLGLPNAGKSTLISAISAARPKVADYPFTTLYPQLGVVRVGPGTSFVVADVPGLIAGAAEGAGLGVRFLKHLARTRLLLHLVDLAPADAHDPLVDVHVVADELAKFSPELAAQERWLVFNKTDLMMPDEAERRAHDIVVRLAWSGPVLLLSAATRSGTSELVEHIAAWMFKSDEALADIGMNP